MATDSDVRKIEELEADNRRLRSLLDERNAPRELRHRLRNTLAVLRTIIRKSAASRSDLDSYVAHLEDRLDALMRMQAAEASGMIFLHNLLADELLHYAADSERVQWSGPNICLQPKAGQLLAMAIHELAVNSVEHGLLGASTGKLRVEWDIAAGSPPSFTLIWSESGLSGIEEPSHFGFGTEILTRTLAYELNATSICAYDGGGLTCCISLPFPDHVGRVLCGN